MLPADPRPSTYTLQCNGPAKMEHKEHIDNTLSFLFFLSMRTVREDHNRQKFLHIVKLTD